MPREQVKLRALNRLTNQINDLIFHSEFIDSVIKIRAKLGIDVRVLQEKAYTSHEKRDAKEFVDTYGNIYARVGALANFLLERRMISQYSADALRHFRVKSPNPAG